MIWQEKKKFLAVHLKNRIKNRMQLRSHVSECLWVHFIAESKTSWLIRVYLSPSWDTPVTVIGVSCAPSCPFAQRPGLCMQRSPSWLGTDTLRCGRWVSHGSTAFSAHWVLRPWNDCLPFSLQRQFVLSCLQMILLFLRKLFRGKKNVSSTKEARYVSKEQWAFSRAYLALWRTYLNTINVWITPAFYGTHLGGHFL